MTGWRVILAAKTHVAMNSIRATGEKMSLARLQRAYYLMGSIQPKTIVLNHECSLNTVADWHMFSTMRKLG